MCSSKKKREREKNSQGEKMKRRDSCRKADLSLCSLRPVVWALTLFDIEMQCWERQSEAEKETQRGRHQSSFAFRGCVNVSHAMMGRLVQGNITLITFISFGEFRQFWLSCSYSSLSGKRTELKIQKVANWDWLLKGNKVMTGCFWPKIHVPWQIHIMRWIMCHTFYK